MWKIQDEIIYHVTKYASKIDKSKEDITCTLRNWDRICTVIPDGEFHFKACKCLWSTAHPISITNLNYILQEIHLNRNSYKAYAPLKK